MAGRYFYWIVGSSEETKADRPPLGLLTLFSVMTLFSLTGFYEIIELWDERYFRGQRIWSPHDAPNDLQWNLAGIIIGRSRLTW